MNRIIFVIGATATGKTYFINQKFNAKDYNINYKYYSLECRKIVDSIIVKQLELF